MSRADSSDPVEQVADSLAESQDRTYIGTDITHDPLCPTVTDPHDEHCDCMCWCDLVALVRANERETVIRAMNPFLIPRKDELIRINYNSGYAAALRDAVEAVNEMPVNYQIMRNLNVYALRREHVVAAIEALGGER